MKVLVHRTTTLTKMNWLNSPSKENNSNLTKNTKKKLKNQQIIRKLLPPNIGNYGLTIVSMIKITNLNKRKNLAKFKRPNKWNKPFKTINKNINNPKVAAKYHQPNPNKTTKTLTGWNPTLTKIIKTVISLCKPKVSYAKTNNYTTSMAEERINSCYSHTILLCPIINMILSHLGSMLIQVWLSNQILRKNLFIWAIKKHQHKNPYKRRWLVK